MKIKLARYAVIAFVILSTTAMAENNTLQQERNAVVKRYLDDLQKADYRDISQLFEKNGIVMSTSRGKFNAKDFFYLILPNFVSAKTELNQTFDGSSDSNRLAARFHLKYELKDGEKSEGEYMDEFVFSDHSVKLKAVYMFENLKFTKE